jgi:hypothetical protein
MSASSGASDNGKNAISVDEARRQYAQLTSEKEKLDFAIEIMDAGRLATMGNTRVVDAIFGAHISEKRTQLEKGEVASEAVFFFGLS